MKRKRTKEEKIKFITDRGWRYHNTLDGIEYYVELEVECDYICYCDYCKCHPLDDAFTSALESDREKFYVLLQDAKKLIKVQESLEASEWMVYYHRWVSI